MTSSYVGRSDDLVAEFRKRLEQLISVCEEVALEESAEFERYECQRIPFCAQMIAEGLKVSLPAARTRKENIEADIRPAEITQDVGGKHHGALFVARKWVGAGRLDSPACWTGIEESGDTNWYAGATGDKGQAVDREVIRGWLYHKGPRPIW